MDIDEIFGDYSRPISLPTKSAIYVWGYNQSGQTGRKGKEHNLRIPRQLPPDLFGCPGGVNSRWLDIACGQEHTAAVASDGSLFTWGANEFGQLGDGTENGRKQPKKVKQLQTEFVISVSCGAHCTAAIAEPREQNGTAVSRRLWVWGQNQGSNYPRLYWGAFAPNTIIRQVSCGAVHVVALSEDGLLQAWGYNECGQLGRGITCEGLQGARVISAYAKFLDEAPELVKITQVSCGEYHTAAISEKGEVYTWGLGSMGQLGHCSLQSGDKELLPRRVVALDGIFIKDIACGGVHTCAVTEKGALYAWGGGQAGQLGLGPQNGFFSCVPNESVMLRNIPVLVIPTGVQLVACGHSHTLISTREGRIHGWGYNSYGQAADERSTYAWYPSPVDWCVGAVRKLAAGGGHSAVLTDACSLKELCEFRLADCITLANAHEIEDVASRTGSDALARLCGRLRERLLDGGDCDYEYEDGRA
ncbi:ultraviolet-B receptor UVR8 [Actinidia eriantha]|uniref:ultraviolet-B receptor UVR8 n=1 Tax=Actinidia eriantha TaxID=165200 RepID=UPI00258B3CB0|nr:ultraviolet-B receptor UVR8 [Actinidia eriantha]